MPYVVDENFGAICKNCKQHFHFSKYQMGHSGVKGVPTFSSSEYGVDDWDGITYPQGNLEVVQATCGWCDTRGDYKNPEEINGPAELMQKEVERRDKVHKVEELRAERNSLRDENKILRQQVAEKDKLLGEKITALAEAYLTLAKFVHEGRKPESKESVNYEGTNPD